MDKQQKHRNEEKGICVIDFLSLTHFNQLSQHHHKYSGTFKYKLRKRKSICKMNSRCTTDKRERRATRRDRKK